MIADSEAAEEISRKETLARHDVMAHIRDDGDTSVSKDSVFDWGFSRGGRDDSSVKSGTISTITDTQANPPPKKSSSTGSDGPSSRYDPKAMSRIVDITDLVDDNSEDDSDDDGIVGHSSSEGEVSSGGRRARRRSSAASGGRKRRGLAYNYGIGCRQAVILASLVAVIAAASVAIGYAVLGSQNSNGNLKGSPQLSVRGGETTTVQYSTAESQANLETAERVITACSESSLDADMSECQEVCMGSMCCFESGAYSCADDPTKNCGVYGGCKALVDGVPADGAEEDEE